MNLNSKELARILCERLSLSETQAKLTIEKMFENISNELAAGREVRLPGFGKFYLHRRPSHEGKIPGDGGTGKAARNTVRFKAFGSLEQRINEISIEDIDQLARLMPAKERRAAPRKKLPQIGTAIVRISGIPVCEFKIKDISEGGNAILVEEDSVVLRNARVGQQVDIWMNRDIASDRSPMVRAKIVHITKPDQPDLSGHNIIGIQLLE